jgi:glutamate-1-semialdehyde 2,1-aminomutase
MSVLSKTFKKKYSKSIQASEEMLQGLSDLRFTDASRVPFPFQKIVRENLNVCSLVEESEGTRLRDLDGNWTIDVSGSYGVNVCGPDVYKQCMERGWERVKDVGLVLGPLHPVMGDVLPALKRISRKDDVSFHMSGTEAVMCAVRLAAFNTRRHLVVVFAGAYHGWWDGVQPGPGNERAPLDILTLKDTSPASLRVIRARAAEIACVIVNPVQGFNPNAPPPNDMVMMSSAMRKATGSDDQDPYRTWLHSLRSTCTACDVPLVFDEVYSGFRMAPGGAQEYYDVEADMVVYGKTLGGGMPVGVVCGSHKLMKRTDPAHPVRVAYVIGTFSGHPLVLGAMAEFLAWVERPQTREIYTLFHARFDKWIAQTNALLKKEDLPIQLANLTSVWTILFTQSGRYNWMLQYYLRAEGVSMAWVGTGRLLVALNFSDADLNELRQRLVAAAKACKRDGWWWTGLPGKPLTDKVIARRVAGEVIHHSLIGMIKESIVGDVLALPECHTTAAGQRRQAPKTVMEFYREVMRRKHDDHLASHSNCVNQFLHIVSSSMFIFCYAYVFLSKSTAMAVGLVSLFLRQMGHAILEPPCHDEEELLLGFNTRAKCFVFASYFISPLAFVIKWITDPSVVEEVSLWNILDPIADAWFGITVFFILGHMAVLWLQHGLVLSLVWWVKFVTDPFTDLPSYSHSVVDVWTTEDWKTASLDTLFGHMNKEPKKKKHVGVKTA